jgi:hypothetical protein
VCFGECLTSSLWHEINAYWFELQGYHAGWSPCTFGLLHLPWPTRWIGNIPFRQWCRFGQGAKGNPKVSTKYKHLDLIQAIQVMSPSSRLSMWSKSFSRK